MKCKYCGKGRPTLWVYGDGFCGDACLRKYADEQTEKSLKKMREDL